MKCTLDKKSHSKTGSSVLFKNNNRCYENAVLLCVQKLGWQCDVKKCSSLLFAEPHMEEKTVNHVVMKKKRYSICRAWASSCVHCSALARG